MSVIQDLTHFYWREMFLKIIKFSYVMLLNIILIEGDWKCCYFEKDCNMQKKIFQRTLMAKKMKQVKIIQAGLTNPDKIELDK